MKIFKSGKFYILRVSIPTLLRNSILKIYDEEQNLVNIENIKENDTVLTALEIFLFFPVTFFLEIEMKQMLILFLRNKIYLKNVYFKQKIL